MHKADLEIESRDTTAAYEDFLSTNKELLKRGDAWPPKWELHLAFVSGWTRSKEHTEVIRNMTALECERAADLERWPDRRAMIHDALKDSSMARATETLWQRIRRFFRR